METAKWKDNEVQENFSQCKTLDEVIQQLESQFHTKGEVICEIRINGVFLSSEDEEKFAGSSLNEIHELEITTEKPDELIADSLRSVLAHLPKIKESALLSADLFRAAPSGKEQAVFSDTMEACHWLTDALSLLRNFLVRKVESEKFVESWNLLEKQYIGVVRELLVAFESQDLIQLSDAMEYDLTTTMDKWLELLQSEDAILRIAATK